jgi:hypothetical protein
LSEVTEAASDVVVDVIAVFTWIVTEFEVDEERSDAPEYMAVTLSEPAGRLDVEMVATPAKREADPIAADPL